MTYETPGAPALDYQPCRYGQSKLLFRGPRQELEGAYFAIVGGSETYGRFVAEPYPAILQSRLGQTVVNFGCMNAGVDVFAGEPAVIAACRKGRASVVQVVGAQNMTNRFYAVHPRRNDRFLRASPLMRSMFGEIDFTEYNFTRHMLSDLKDRAPERFLLIETELREAWVARMRDLLTRLGPRTILLWLGGHHAQGRLGGLGPSPLLVSDAMLHAVEPFAGRLVRVTPSEAARRSGTEGMVHSEFDMVAAAELPGPAVHAEIADALEPVLRAYL